MQRWNYTNQQIVYRIKRALNSEHKPRAGSAAPPRPRGSRGPRAPPSAGTARATGSASGSVARSAPDACARGANADATADARSLLRAAKRDHQLSIINRHRRHCPVCVRAKFIDGCTRLQVRICTLNIYCTVGIQFRFEVQYCTVQCVVCTLHVRVQFITEFEKYRYLFEAYCTIQVLELELATQYTKRSCIMYRESRILIHEIKYTKILNKI